MKFSRNGLKFEVHLAEHCNLNCKGCFHFSNIADPEYLKIEDYEKDVQRLSFLYGGKMDQILLLGGEPLLNQDIEIFIAETRKAFPIGKIGIVTNGILLPNIKISFWQSCKDNAVTLMPTKYPINVDYDKIENIAANYSITVEYFNNKDIEKKLSVLSIDKNGRQDAINNFYNCYRADFCVTLEHGRLYTCIMPSHFRHYIKFFDLDIEDFANDGIDIHKASSVDEIDNFLAKPIRACSYCNMEKWRDGEKWETSKKSIDEWI